MRKKSETGLEVAVPWNLSHYIALNGFHPLYRALFDHAAEGIHLHTWDNVKLHRRFNRDRALRDLLLELAKNHRDQCYDARHTSVSQYWNYYRPADHILTACLPGDIEFHHTALFPSLTRPFIFHCEMFAPLFYPFAHQGTGLFEFPIGVKEHYRTLLAHPLCLGIWSHVPETLESFRKYFADPIINRKLFLSRIGLSADSVGLGRSVRKPSLSTPRFLFINSAHQNPNNFVKRGGHVVLRFWKEFLAAHRGGKLFMRCKRPEKTELADQGVDVSFVQKESGNSILWIEEVLFQHELNELFAHCHFLLLPSFSLHSASILHALSFGTIPIVSDTIGTDVYVKDGVTGIVVKGMRSAVWQEDPATGIPVDHYRWTPELEEALASQMVHQIRTLLKEDRHYAQIHTNVLASARDEFSGPMFANSFWSHVATVYERDVGTERRQIEMIARHMDKGMPELDDCLLDRSPTEWRRIFESPPQPMPRIEAGNSVIWELGGVLVQSTGPRMREPHDFSVINEQGCCEAFAYRLEELGGAYLAPMLEKEEEKLSRLLAPDGLIVPSVKRALRPFPFVYRLASSSLRLLRRALWKRRDDRSLLEMAPPDIELCKEGVCGYNVIRCDDRYYAILQSEGEFILSKVENGGYSKCFIADSAEKVIAQIIADQLSHMVHPVKARSI